MQYLPFAKKLARQAGQLIKTNFTLGMTKTWKEDNTPLTVTDTTINQLIIDAVKRHYPDHDVMAEEGSSLTNRGDYVWVCDPLDGTIPFSHGIPTAVFSLALTWRGQAIFGVVYDPFCDRFYFAEKDKGAFLNEKPIRVNAVPMDKSLIGITHWDIAPYNVVPLIEPLQQQKAMTIALDSTIYMGMLVACGELTAVVFPGSKAHDGAAVKIIVEESGGIVTDLFGNEQSYSGPIKGYIASNRVIYSQILATIKKYKKQIFL